MLVLCTLCAITGTRTANSNVVFVWAGGKLRSSVHAVVYQEVYCMLRLGLGCGRAMHLIVVR